MKEIKTIRKERRLTQLQAAEMLGVSLRSYKSYENDESKKNSIKYKYLYEKLNEYVLFDEDHGVLDLEFIEQTCQDICTKYQVEFCYLFGSYAKGLATQSSDIDLLLSSNLKGLQFYALVEELRSNLYKRVDVLDMAQLVGNIQLTEEILRDGVKIYGVNKR